MNARKICCNPSTVSLVLVVSFVIKFSQETTFVMKDPETGKLDVPDNLQEALIILASLDFIRFDEDGVEVG